MDVLTLRGKEGLAPELVEGLEVRVDGAKTRRLSLGVRGGEGNRVGYLTDSLAERGWKVNRVYRVAAREEDLQVTLEGGWRGALRRLGVTDPIVVDQARPLVVVEVVRWWSPTVTAVAGEEARRGTVEHALAARGSYRARVLDLSPVLGARCDRAEVARARQPVKGSATVVYTRLHTGGSKGRRTKPVNLRRAAHRLLGRLPFLRVEGLFIAALAGAVSEAKQSEAKPSGELEIRYGLLQAVHRENCYFQVKVRDTRGGTTLCRFSGGSTLQVPEGGAVAALTRDNVRYSVGYRAGEEEAK